MANTFNHSFIQDDPKVAQINLNGNIMGDEAMDFDNLLNELFNAKIATIIVNLEKVDIMNSSGLGMLVSGHSKSKKQGVNFCMVQIPEKIEKLLQMTHLDKLFRVSASVEEALKDC
jgi:anti-sigma B factor antagonist